MLQHNGCHEPNQNKVKWINCETFFCYPCLAQIELLKLRKVYIIIGLILTDASNSCSFSGPEVGVATTRCCDYAQMERKKNQTWLYTSPASRSTFLKPYLTRVNFDFIADFAKIIQIVS